MAIRIYYGLKYPVCKIMFLFTLPRYFHSVRQNAMVCGVVVRVYSALCTLSECWAGVWSGGELAISIPSCRLSAQSQIPLPCNIGKLANSLLYFQHQMKINTDFTQHSSTITHQITSLSILMQSTSSVLYIPLHLMFDFIIM